MALLALQALLLPIVAPQAIVMIHQCVRLLDGIGITADAGVRLNQVNQAAQPTPALAGLDTIGMDQPA